MFHSTLVVVGVDVAKLVFKRCSPSNDKHPENEDYKITFNYEFLDDVFANVRMFLCISACMNSFIHLLNM